MGLVDPLSARQGQGLNSLPAKKPKVIKPPLELVNQDDRAQVDRPSPRYADLFPSRDAGVLPIIETPSSGEGETNQAGVLGVKAANFDSENDAYSEAVKNRNISKLTQFAGQLAEHISIPAAIDRIQTSGKAYARFGRGHNGVWSVVRVDGDSYFRAILYEAITQMDQNNIGMIQLAKSEFDTVRIDFEYEAIKVIGIPVPKSMGTKLFGNQILFTMRKQYNDQKWMMVATSPTGLPMLNLLGVLMLAHQPDSHSDFEMTTLRRSPAFLHPIGR
jgi:hypothetical protein